MITRSWDLNWVRELWIEEIKVVRERRYLVRRS